ncbi:NAD-dependent epimerase/dehydratase family protein [Neobacillus muris]|uniref:NAD-dependent epimerase/dehydratase family protein n=1 Tax=Neobacillus muris TaxID=2941334 RepID=UPI00203EEC82|nr:NAD-dependent epimerase/dehydratase family protein [Neobacillus muris]
MVKVLVLGGTRFFGVHLVETLIKMGLDVTIATRGRSKDSFSGKVKRITFDRSNLLCFKNTFKGTKWDVVFDQICYSSEDAYNAIEVFTDKTKKYVLTSSNAVYSFKESELREEDFNPYLYKIKKGSRETFTYQEGKRQSEAVLFQEAPFPVVAVRFPIVLGENDYTNRLNFHIQKVTKNEELYFHNMNAATNFISEKEAGQFLAWCSLQDVEGPINACSNHPISLAEVVTFIENETKQTALIAKKEDKKNLSPFSIPLNWVMCNKKAQLKGFIFTDVYEWLPKLIRKVVINSRA